ncbi:hypothetical protein Tco_0245621 [Tanacetum coccineum]
MVRFYVNQTCSLPEHLSEMKVFTMKMEILLEPTSNKLLVGNLCDSIRIKLVSTGKNDVQFYDNLKMEMEMEIPSTRNVK